MTKSQLIERIARRNSHLIERDIALAVNTMLEHMTAWFAGGGRIEIRGFRSFSLRYRRARMARDPRTGTPVSIAARYAALQAGDAATSRSSASCPAPVPRNQLRRVRILFVGPWPDPHGIP